MLHPSKKIVKLRKRKVKWQEDSEENRFTKPRAGPTAIFLTQSKNLSVSARAGARPEKNDLDTKDKALVFL